NGRPTSRGERPRNRSTVSGNDTAIVRVMRAAASFASPGIALASWIRAGTPDRRAAATTGKLGYPPIPTTTDAFSLRMTRRACAVAGTIDAAATRARRSRLNGATDVVCVRYPA